MSSIEDNTDSLIFIISFSISILRSIILPFCSDSLDVSTAFLIIKSQPELSFRESLILLSASNIEFFMLLMSESTSSMASSSDSAALYCSAMLFSTSDIVFCLIIHIGSTREPPNKLYYYGNTADLYSLPISATWGKGQLTGK